MTYRLQPMLGVCVLFVGCAGPVDRAWDDPTYHAIQDRYAEEDRRAGESGIHRWPSIEIGSIDTLGVNDAIRIAIANHPALRQAGYRIDAADGRRVQAGMYPNPSFVFNAEALGSDDGAAGDTIYGIEQEIVLGGKLRRARDVAESDRLAARAAFAGEEFAIASRVTRAFAGAAAAEERLKRRRELADLASHLLDAVSARSEAGAATEPDRLRAELAGDQARIALEAARLEVLAARRALASSMGLEAPIEIALDFMGEVLPELPAPEVLAAGALEANSRVSLARIAIERARGAHELAKAQAVPNLAAFVGPRYSDSNNETTLDVGLGIEIPLFDRNQGEIQAAVADRLSAAAELRGVQLQLLNEVSEAWAAYESSRLAAVSYRDSLLPKADRTLELTREALEHGKTDYVRVLDAQQVVSEARIAYVDAWQRLHEAAALLRELAQTEAPWRDTPTDTEVTR